jgi:hypothetical protein
MPAGGTGGGGQSGRPNDGGDAGTAGLSSAGGAGGSAGVAARGGGSGTGGDAGGSAMGGIAGAGGAAPPCVDPDATSPETYQTRTTTTGTDGTFTDECDAAGNLIEYMCEAFPPTDVFCGQPNPNPRCLDLIPTGRVLPVMLECAGTCSEGTCASRCPEIGDELVYTTFDDATGAATLGNPAREAEYSCVLARDYQPGGHDCIADPEVGDEMTVTYRRSFTTAFCVQGEMIGVTLGFMGTSVTECGYDCTRTQ